MTEHDWAAWTTSPMNDAEWAALLANFMTGVEMMPGPAEEEI